MNGKAAIFALLFFPLIVLGEVELYAPGTVQSVKAGFRT